MTAPKNTAPKLSAAAQEIEEFFQRKQLNTAPAWMPEPGTVMAAEVVGLRMGADNGYGTYPVIVYKLDSGEFVSVHAFHTLLRARLAELKTEIGKRQILSYDGKKRKNKATPEEIEKGLADYHMYYVENAGEVAATAKEEGFTF
jgi:hypothetical protein